MTPTGPGVSELGLSSALALYPLNWNTSTGHATIDDEAILLDRYTEVFTPDAVDTILESDSRALFCESSGFMIGQGTVWGNVSSKGRYGITTLNV